MSTFTLDDIRAAADAKYGSLDIPVEREGFDGGPERVVVRLLNPLRLPKEKRDKLAGLQAELENEDDERDITEKLGSAIRVIAQTEAQADALLAKIGHDAAQLAIVFERYTKQESAGEA